MPRTMRAKPAASMLGLLHLAMMMCEARLAAHLDEVIDAGDTPDLEQARNAVAPPSLPRMPTINIAVPDPAIYDRLLEAGAATSELVNAIKGIPS